MKLLSIILMFASLLGIVLGAILSSKAIRDLITETYVFFQTRLETGKTGREIAIPAAYKALQILYTKDKQLSIKKMLYVVVSLNIAYWIIAALAAFWKADWPVAIAVVAGITVGAIIFEYLSVKITLFLYSKANKSGLIRYVFSDAVALFVLLYALPAIAGVVLAEHINFSTELNYGSIPGTFLFWMTPIAIVAVIIELPPLIAVLIIPSVLSLCLPTAVGTCVAALFQSRHATLALVRMTETISAVGAKRLLNASITLLGVAAAILAFAIEGAFGGLSF